MVDLKISRLINKWHWVIKDFLHLFSPNHKQEKWERYTFQWHQLRPIHPLFIGIAKTISDLNTSKENLDTFSDSFLVNFAI